MNIANMIPNIVYSWTKNLLMNIGKNDLDDDLIFSNLENSKLCRSKNMKV